MRYTFLTNTGQPGAPWTTAWGSETDDINEAFRALQRYRTVRPDYKSMIVDTVAGVVLADATYEAAAV